MNTETITPDDRQIVALLVEGHDNREIGLHVGLPEQAVKNRLRLLYFRAGIESGSKRVKLAQMFSAADEKRVLPKLAPREREVAELVIRGFKNREIAALCNVNESTIKNYLRFIFDKCGVWSRTELAARFRCA